MVAYHIYNELDPVDGVVIFEVDVRGLEITINTPWNVFVRGDISPERIRVYRKIDKNDIRFAAGKIGDNLLYWAKCGLEETIRNIIRG
jgi:hypothetical protein